MGKILFNNLDFILQQDHPLFTDDTKLDEVVDSVKGAEALQRDPDRLECQAVINCIKFNKSRCWILPLGSGNPEYTCRLGNERLESSPIERSWGFWSMAS